MVWRIEFDDRARKQIARLDPVVARRIIEFMRTRVSGSSDPRQLAERLKGSRFGDLWRFRVGHHRVIATIEDDLLRVLVVQIGHRREVYR